MRKATSTQSVLELMFYVIYLSVMNGQVQSSRERLGFNNSSTEWPSGMIATNHVSNIPTILPISNGELDESAVGSEVDNKVKTKLLSMWNNMKYGWSVKIKTNFSKESPVWLLGHRYLKKAEESVERASEAEGLNEETGSEISLAIDAATFDEGIEGFKRDFMSRLWLTYRREFPILNGSSFTTDCGWGCMLRSGQMMLAQALVCHFLGREWRWRPDEIINTYEQRVEENKHRMIIQWFGDQPTKSPLSIHTLVSLSASTGKKAGDWYGPGSVAHLLSKAVKQATQSHPEFNNLAVYVAQDCAVYLDDVRSECENTNGTWKSLVLFVPLKLGADKLNLYYAPCLTALLSLDTCIGVIGGRPRHSLYFIGYQEDKLIHLDPHYCQETVDVWKENFSLATFHCTSPRKILLSKMDPSCCVGFYLQDKSTFDNFVQTIEPFLVPPNQKVDYPMFLFCEGKGEDIRKDIEVGENPLPSSALYAAQETCEDDHYETEEFELI
ncbi:cysteine protease ATG4D [Prorops nasuta]|uniref:cysteine protease ATG4D n=1 Tax=Prorops nasuta TaxID=863751 RepID=UPI0034CD8858